jgi:hypothetical protein
MSRLRLYWSVVYPSESRFDLFSGYEREQASLFDLQFRSVRSDVNCSVAVLRVPDNGIHIYFAAASTRDSRAALKIKPFAV